MRTRNYHSDEHGGNVAAAGDRRAHHFDAPGRRRGAFTLVEMLVVIAIVLVLAALSVTAVTLSLEGDRIRSGARQMQSYLEGARDRAIFAREPRGVRFLLNQDGPVNREGNPTTVSSLVFISEPMTQPGELRIEADGQTITQLPECPPGPGDDTTARRWRDLANTKRVLRPGARILIGGLWFTIQSDPFNLPTTDCDDASVPVAMNQDRLYLDRPHEDFAMGTAGASLDYTLELLSAILPNQEPVQLPDGIVIELEQSRLRGKLPTGWHYDPDGTGPNEGIYSDEMDVLFSPRGTVVGAAATTGVIHFVLSDVRDVIYNAGDGLGGASAPNTRPLGNADASTGRTSGDSRNREGEELIVTIFTQTGHISSHEVDVDDQFNSMGAATPDGFADDPFRFAETGEAAK